MFADTGVTCGVILFAFGFVGENRVSLSNFLKPVGCVGGGVPVRGTPHNLRYLIAKRDRLGHLIELAEPAGDGR